MNSFEGYTLLIGALAVLLEGISYVREFVNKLLHK